MPFYGILLVLLGLLVAVMPFVGQFVGLDMEADPFAGDQMIRHGIPAVAIVVSGLLMLPRFRPLRVFAGLVAVAAGVWLVSVPTVLAWLTGDIFRSEAAFLLGAYYATGAAVIFFAGLAVGVASGKWLAVRRAAYVATEEEALAREEEERAYEEELAYEEGRADEESRHRDDHEPASHDDEVRAAEDADAVDTRRVDDVETHDDADQPVSERRPRGEPDQDPEDVTSGGRTD
jgi:hypothetical protein